MTANNQTKKGHPGQLGGDGMTLLNTQENRMFDNDGTTRTSILSAEPPPADTDTAMADTIADHLVTVGLACGLSHEQIVRTVLATIAQVRAEITKDLAVGGAR